MLRKNQYIYYINYTEVIKFNIKQVQESSFTCTLLRQFRWIGRRHFAFDCFGVRHKHVYVSSGRYFFQCSRRKSANEGLQSQIRKRDGPNQRPLAFRRLRCKSVVADLFIGKSERETEIRCRANGILHGGFNNYTFQRRRVPSTQNYTTALSDKNIIDDKIYKTGSAPLRMSIVQLIIM